MPRFAANLTMVFNEHEFLDRFDAAAKAGFTAVEFLFPYEHPPEAIAERLQRHVKSIDNALQRIKRKVEAHLQARSVADAG